MGKVVKEEEIQEAEGLIKRIGPDIGSDNDGSDISRLCEINVHWVLANPEPIKLENVNYTR